MPHDHKSQLIELGRAAHARGWVMGTSGNFSVLESREPFRLTITASGFHKGTLTPDQFVSISETGTVQPGNSKPSAETALHLVIVRERGATAVLHTHSVWSTILSDLHGNEEGFWVEGYEMLKGLEGVTTHQHREWLPIIENDQDMPRLSSVVEETLRAHPQAHGFLLRNHGLYTWGDSLEQATRHLEILEFLLEVIGRKGTDGHR